MEKSCIIKSVFIEGYSWVEFPDELWDTIVIMDYYEGIPLFTSERRR